MFSTLKRQYPQLVEDVRDLSMVFREQLLEHLPPLEDGAVRLIGALNEAGIPWGIVTNGSAQQLRKVEKLDLADRAACIVISEVVGVRKPDPAIFHSAAASITVAPSRILFVGDHPEIDMAGAAGAGMQTAWLRRGRSWPAYTVEVVPHVMIDTFDELLWLAGGKSLRAAIIDEAFWEHADDLVATSEVVIERPRGSVHPRYPELLCPLDYGFLAGTTAGDGSGIDVWLGSLHDRRVTGVIVTIDTRKRDAEVKLPVSCTREDAQRVQACHSQGQQAALLMWRDAGATT